MALISLIRKFTEFLVFSQLLDRGYLRLECIGFCTSLAGYSDGVEVLPTTYSPGTASILLGTLYQVRHIWGSCGPGC